jgi:hypothetical protein
MVNKTKFTSKQADDSWVTHWTSSIPGGPLPSNYEDHELHLFAFPELLKGDKLLKVAERYTNKQINDNIIAATVGDALEKKIITIAGIANRITTALGQKAKQDGITVAEVTKAFRAARKANGIPIREAKVKEAASDGNDTLPVRNDDDDADDDEDGE